MLMKNTKYQTMSATFQVSTILRPTGKFISITFAQPHFRKQFWAKESFGWSIDTRTFGTSSDSIPFFYYVMEKGKHLSADDLQAVARYKANREKKHEIVYVDHSEDDVSFLQNNFGLPDSS